MPSPETQVEVAFFIKPAESRGSTKFLETHERQQVVGVDLGSEMVGYPTDARRRFTMPLDLAHRIVDGVVALYDNVENYNCHRISRVITGVLDPNWDKTTDEPENVNGEPKVPGLQPPLFSYDRAVKKTASSIDMGAVGIVGALTPDNELEVLHSVVGLGSEESLHFARLRGIINLVSNPDLLDFCRSIKPTALEVDLWQLDQSILYSPPVSIPARQDVSR
ncbi:MAG TPA: hypothetical protein VMR95_03995 [Candidatus Binatia bacterium]|nr:hypothetical protein [Candidatus Binatia bacterium]